MKNRQAFMALDMLFGIIVVGAVSITLLNMVRHEREAEHGLADARGALHLAEHTLLNLQHGQPAPKTNALLNIRPANGSVAPPGFVWTKVDATVNGHTQSLFGVVPIASLSSAGIKS